MSFGAREECLHPHPLGVENLVHARHRLVPPRAIASNPRLPAQGAQHDATAPVYNRPVCSASIVLEDGRRGRGANATHRPSHLISLNPLSSRSLTVAVGSNCWSLGSLHPLNPDEMIGAAAGGYDAYIGGPSSQFCPRTGFCRWGFERPALGTFL